MKEHRATRDPAHEESATNTEQAEASRAASPPRSLVDVPMQPNRENRTGVPDGLLSRAEAISGQDLSDVRVHHSSSRPAQVGALAYAQGTEIHLGPGNGDSLPHELWHSVQQKQGRVAATGSVNGQALNDDPRLEEEADRMGARLQQGDGA